MSLIARLKCLRDPSLEQLQDFRTIKLHLLNLSGRCVYTHGATRGCTEGNVVMCPGCGGEESLSASRAEDEYIIF